MHTASTSSQHVALSLFSFGFQLLWSARHGNHDVLGMHVAPCMQRSAKLNQCVWTWHAAVTTEQCWGAPDGLCVRGLHAVTCMGFTARLRAVAAGEQLELATKRKTPTRTTKKAHKQAQSRRSRWHTHIPVGNRHVDLQAFRHVWHGQQQGTQAPGCQDHDPVWTIK